MSWRFSVDWGNTRTHKKIPKTKTNQQEQTKNPKTTKKSKPKKKAKKPTTLLAFLTNKLLHMHRVFSLNLQICLKLKLIIYCFSSV